MTRTEAIDEAGGANSGFEAVAFYLHLAYKDVSLEWAKEIVARNPKVVTDGQLMGSMAYWVGDKIALLENLTAYEEPSGGEGS